MSRDLLIHDLAPLGDGIHQSGEGRVYVDRALPGDTVQAKVHRAGGVFRGELQRIVSASPHRVMAPCVHYDVCGGCTLQHACETFYRDWKVGIVRTALAKRGLAPERWLEPVFLPGGNRRRATFAALKTKTTVTLGYFRRRSHHVTAISSCLIADPAIMDLRGKLAAGLADVLQEGKAADVFIQTINGQCEVVITGAVGRRGAPDLQVHEAVAQLAAALRINRVAWRARDHDEPEILVEMTPMRATFGVLNVVLPPLAFLQPTKVGEDALVQAVMEALPPRGTFADLFSGCGTFAGSMLSNGAVDAYDSVTPAVRALEKAREAHLLQARRRDLFRDPLRPDEAERYDAVVFDPPRAGAEEQARSLAASGVAKLVGVSCNPVTFARDAHILADGGYTLESVKVVDQFTWSHHVEVVGVFTRRTT